ncbi:MAG: ATP-binding protein [Fimbriimonadales bacterium]
MTHLPSGALELLIALATPTPKGYFGVPVLLWGSPGTGKSTFIESLQQKDFPVVTMIASLHDPTDFSGLPMLVDGRMRFAPPDWTTLFEGKKGGILLLDELTTAPPTVQAALLRLVLERKVGAHPLPPTVRIAAAANPPEIAASGWELSSPLANRFVHIQWNLETETYLHALGSGFSSAELPEIDLQQFQERTAYWRYIVQGYLKRGGSLYSQPAEDEYAYATPRSWDFAIALMAGCDVLGYAPRPDTRQSGKNTNPFIRLIYGCVGSGTAQSFLGYLRDLRIPDPQEVLEGKVQVDTSLREDELHTLFGAMADILEQRHKQGTLKTQTVARFLTEAERVASNRKSDSLYTALRRSIQNGVLQAHAGDASIRETIRRLEPYYADLIKLLAQTRAPRGTHPNDRSMP